MIENKKTEIKIDLKNPLRSKAVLKGLAALTVIGLTSVGTYLFADNYTLDLRSPILIQNPVVIESRLIEVIQEASPSTEVMESTPSAVVEDEITVLYDGKVSYYSHAGCLGCNDKQIMGNGHPFDENAMTLAIPCEDIISGEYKYGTKVTVTNNDTFLSSDATITDCGGFSKYNRIADLSAGLYKKLGAKTDISNIVIYKK